MRNPQQPLFSMVKNWKHFLEDQDQEKSAPLNSSIQYIFGSPCCCFCTVTKSRWMQQARLPCPSLSPGVCLNSCPLSWWCHLTISSSVALFSSCSQFFPASGSVLMSWLFGSVGPSIGASASASVLPINIQGWFPLGLHWFMVCPFLLVPKFHEGEDKVLFKSVLPYNMVPST